MSLLEIFHALEYSPLLVEMRASPWLFPAIATIHLFGLATIGGAVLIVDLRLLGLGLSSQSARDLERSTRPILLGGLALMLLTGPFLFMCFATKYYYLTAFWVKLAALGTVLVFSFTWRPRVAARADEAQASAGGGKLAALASISLWLAVALGGRLIGFP